MLRMVRSIAVRAGAGAALALALAGPGDVRGGEPAVEATFLPETFPPGGPEVALSQTGSEPAPRAQLALPLGDRLGLTADVGAHEHEGRLAADTPAASLKVLALAPERGRTGLSFSLDLLGSAHDAGEAEAGVGAGVLRAAGPVTGRLALWAGTGVTAWAPHLHAGLSGAVRLGAARLLVETVADLRGDGVDLAAGPTVKVPLGTRATVAAGALAGLTRAGPVQWFGQLAIGL